MARSDSTRSLRNRTRIAQAAARLIAEHGLVDWSAAKRKACRELGLPAQESLPGNEEVEQALRDYNSLFRATTQPVSLRAQRSDALRWMERLARWAPVLTGAVAAGWATEHSEVRLELEAEDAKAVELELINAGVPYSQMPDHGPESVPQLRIESPAATVRLVILSPQQRRNRPRRERSGGAEERLTAAQLKSLLGTAEPTSSATPPPTARSR
ncbi:MAG TPA: hypothetical protein VFR50_13350 [Casimicrobiaceae bacterium]|nr:hypothetical protein [Casimicrobiaceae bacterium]